MFGWFVENLVPVSYTKVAGEEDISIHTLLCEKASRLVPGESGLLALDWWNGNKTPLVNGNLQGILIGMNLNTKPEEIYRALVEATAFGTKRILELYEEAGLQIKEIICSGGISLKNPMLMQIYANVLGKELKIAASSQTAALGAAIYASLSAGKAAGGYDEYTDAVRHMSRVKDIVYLPDTQNNSIYEELYLVYKEYSSVMGESSRNILERLQKIKSE